MNRRRFKIGLCLLLCVVASRDQRADEPREQQLQALANLPRFKHAHWGWLFADLESGQTVCEQNADKLFAPASTTKLYSVACALDAYGAEHRFETPLLRRGSVSAGELEGDLILVARGDLTLGGRTNDAGEIAFTNTDHTYANGFGGAELTAPDPLAGLNELARQTVAAGIRRVRGDVLVDDRLFDKAEGTGSGPSRVTPIQVNDNVLDFVFEPTEEGQPAKVTWRPQTAAFRVETQVDTVAKNGKLETWIHDLGGGRIHVHGKIPAGHAKVVRVYEVSDAASFARTLLIEALGRAGVTVTRPALGENDSQRLPERAACDALPVVGKIVSPPFSESARLILKVSHNLQASTLPLLVAVKHNQRTLADGLLRQHDFLQRIGVDVDTISFGGGAGGARADYITPRATTQLLRHMATRPDFAQFQRALPVLGVDGTLAKSVAAESAARGQVQAKTGTLLWSNTLNGGSLLTSKALAGYLTTAKGRKLAFAAFVNNVHLRDGVDTTTIGRDLGRLCEIVHACE